MDPTDTLDLKIEFEGVESRVAGQYARQLADVVQETDPSVRATLGPSDPLHQELGTILGVVLGAKAVVALSKGIADWLKLRHQASITIKCKGSEVVAKNITSADVDKLAKLIAEKCV
jgi:hypothetical protein